jgi:hypothetical protein
MSNTEAASAPQLVFITRDAATNLIVEAGVPIGRTALANMASNGKGPPYYMVHNRALYKRAEILAWIAAEASRPPPRRGGERTVASAP